MMISVCVCTFKRPSLLETLESIAAQVIPPSWDIELIVVDNDAGGSARDAVRAWAVRVPIPLTYAVEPGPNISKARNRTLSLARGDWLAFLDDDEVADPFWLATLIEAAEHHRADIVVGRVAALYPPETPAWLVAADPLSRDWGPTGSVRQTGSTANAFVRREIIASSGIRFDEELGRTGGEDTAFFSALHQQGAKIVVCREALVSELIPPSRIELAYLRRRAVRSGQSYGQMRLRSAPSLHRWAFLAGCSAKAVSFFALSMALGAVMRSASCRLRIRAWLNLGKLRACLGLQTPVMY